ncbi:MAG TPA: Wzz/FepE/Etk N-terminal domain-containing protein, partial [Armatimonadota bacterium]|nr:Wzz/FepE/Etk N-terminal domain-containing protein [Armatimonadota bacterium]
MIRQHEPSTFEHTPSILQSSPRLTHTTKKARVDLRSCWNTLVRHRWIILSIFGISLVAGIIYVSSRTRVYQSTAKILIAP